MTSQASITAGVGAAGPLPISPVTVHRATHHDAAPSTSPLAAQVTIHHDPTTIIANTTKDNTKSVVTPSEKDGVVATTGRHPEESSWILGRIWFTWVTPLIRKGAAQPLQHSDLFQLPWYESSTKLNQLYWQAAAEQYREQQHKQSLAAVSGSSNGTTMNDTSNGTGTSSNTSGSKGTASGSASSNNNAYGMDDELLAADASRAEASMTKKSFIAAMIRLVRVPFYASALLQLIYAVAQTTQPLVLERLVKSMTLLDSNDGLYYAIIMFGMVLIGCLCNQMHLYLALKAGQRLRAVSISLVYRKSLQLNSSGTKGLTTGEIVNLISNDSQRFYDVASTFHLLWACPLQIIASIYFLIDLLGAPALTGVFMLILMLPMYSMVARWNQRVRSKHMPITDERLKMCSEILQGMRVVKLLGWELPFMTKILNKRAQEMWFIKREYQIWGCIVVLLLMAPVFATTLTFVTYSSTGHFLTPDKSFTALAFFSNLRFPLTNLGTSINTAIQLRTSIGRLSAFMVRQNVRSMYIRSTSATTSSSTSTSNGPENDNHTSSKEALISINNACFSWLGVAPPSATDKKKPLPDTTAATKSSIVVKVDSSAPTMDVNANATNGATKSGGEFQLRDVNITAMRGELLTIVGTVGSGKSTLVDGILGEATIINGSMHVNGNIAYVAQQAWILNATVRENILFGKEWDEDYYNRVLDACALWPDLDGMADGDRTMVGEKGLTMSGGQKQRLSLARCAYARADISILDDPLSALDSHTGKYIFDALLGPRGLMRNHGVTLLVTHATHFLSQSSYVIVLHSGHMVFNGPYNELVSYVETSTNTTNVTKMTNATISSSPTIPTHTTSSKGNGHTSSVGEVDTKMNLAPTPSSRTAIKLSRDELRTVLSSLITEQEEGSGGEHDHKASSSSSSLSSNGDDTTTDAANQATKKKPIAMYAAGLARATANGKDGKLMTTEERERGSVGLEVWAQYIKCIGGAPIAVCVVLLLSVERFCFIASDWWISCWSGAYSGPPSGDWNLNMRSALTIEDQHYYMYGYLIWTGATAFLAIIRVSLFAQLGGRAASTLFTRLLTSIFRSPMVFFETTPVGRIVARLAYDTDVVDGTLISRVMGCFSSVYWVVSATVVISNVSLWMLCVILPLLVIYYFIQKYYRRSCVELQRLDALSRSPIQGHFQESLQGTATIRAYGQQARFIKESDLRVDTNQTALFSFTVAARWLAVRLETMGAIVLLGTGILCWAARNNGISGSMAGLAIMWSYNFTLGLNSVCLTFTEVEAKMVSVERIEQYSYLPPEPPLSYSEPTKLQTVPSDWPSSGAIEFNNVTMSYRDGLEPALRNMSVIIHGGEKIGVVGRTGAGKSTIATALFRLRDPSEGTIKVDGIDLHYLGLDDVRSRSLCIIPQDPVLFSGPLRYNFDPFGQYTDDDIWIALEQVRMASSIRRMKDGLLTKVEEKGSNFSVGERQLFCLVRALLRKSKILLLDEATASVDPETDAFIQRTVRSSFTKTTLLTIAHRLHTVMDYDRIMVMDNGRVAEIGRPIDLLANNQSMLSKLVDSTGHAAAQQLRTLAINAAAANNAANNGTAVAGSDPISPSPPL